MVVEVIFRYFYLLYIAVTAVTVENEFIETSLI